MGIPLIQLKARENGSVAVYCFQCGFLGTVFHGPRAHWLADDHAQFHRDRAQAYALRASAS